MDPAETDSALVQAARDGDVASFGRLVERYQAVAHRTAYFLGAGDETPDVVQDAFVKAYQALRRFRPGEPFRPWLLTIVANETRNKRRWHARHHRVSLALVDETLADPDPPTEVQVEDRAAAKALRDAVAALPLQQRDVVTCRYLLELSEEETASVLRIPRGTVKSRLSRGLEALRKSLVGGRERSDV